MTRSNPARDLLLAAAILCVGLVHHAAPAGAAAQDPSDQDPPVTLGTPDGATLKRLQDLAARRGATDLLVRLTGDDVRGIPLPTVDQQEQTRLQAARERFVLEAGLPLAVLTRGGQRQSRTLPLVFLELLPSELDGLVARSGPPAAAGPAAPMYRVMSMPQLRQQGLPPARAGTVGFDQVLVDLEILPVHAELNGVGQTIVIIDTGIQHDLPDLAGRLVAAYHAGTEEPRLVVTANGEAPAERCVDHLCHGSQVAWIAAQIAPSAQLVSARVDELNSLGANPSVPLDNVVAALEDVLEVWSQPPIGARVVNMSLSVPANEEIVSGTGPCKSGPGSPVHFEAVGALIKALQGEGVAVVVAGGNDDLPHALPAGGGGGSPAALGFPGCLESAVSVVGTRPENGYSAEPSTTFERRFHPSNWAPHADLAAPAAFFTSRVRKPTGGEWELSLGPGTSMSAAFVAGSIALLLESGHATDVIVAQLKATGRRIPDPPPESGRTTIEIPQIRVLPALRALEGISIPAEASVPSGGGSGGG